MSVKTKITNTVDINKLSDAAQQAGVVLMTAAVTLGLVAEHPNTRVVLLSQPAMALAGQHSSGNDPLRREREDTAPHYVSYSVSQRTPARSGKQ